VQCATYDGGGGGDCGASEDQLDVSSNLSEMGSDGVGYPKKNGRGRSIKGRRLKIWVIHRYIAYLQRRENLWISLQRK